MYICVRMCCLDYGSPWLSIGYNYLWVCVCDFMRISIFWSERMQLCTKNEFA